MKTYVTGNYELLVVDENFKATKVNARTSDMIDYTYFIPEDGRVMTEKGMQDVKAGDVVLSMYGLRTLLTEESPCGDDPCERGTDEGQIVFVLPEGELKDYIVKNAEIDKANEEFRKTRRCNQCEQKYSEGCISNC